ncbi:MAG: T9SS type A sorting domain-containing protein [Saprospiraceae bacterium]
MKLLAKSIVALFFTCATLIANANVEPIVSVRSQNGQSFSLHLKNIENVTYRIELVDQKGKVLVKEQVKNQDDYVKMFNLSNLPMGDYQLRIENANKVVFQDITVQGEQVIVDASTKAEVIKSIPKAEKLSTKAAAINNKIKWLQARDN